MNTIEERLVNKYLYRFYPVMKVKTGKHFRRGIEITDNINGIRVSTNILLNTVSNRKKINEYIIKDLIKVFGFNRINVLKIVEEYIFFR
jgi:hypothetical protein